MRACPTCGELRDEYASCDVRIEFRTLRKYDRDRVVGVGYSCTTCSREIAELLRNDPAKARVMRAILEAARDTAAARGEQGRLV